MQRYVAGPYYGAVKKTGQKGPIGYVVVDTLDEDMGNGSNAGRVVALFHYRNTQAVSQGMAESQAKAYAQLLEIAQ